MSLFLTRAEVAELTGAQIKRRQIEVLVRNGIRHTVNAVGWPMVIGVRAQMPKPCCSGTGCAKSSREPCA